MSDHKEEFDPIIIKDEHIGQVFEVECHHGGKFIVTVLNPDKESVQVKHEGSDFWPAFTTEGKLKKILYLGAIPVPKKTTHAALVAKVIRH